MGRRPPPSLRSVDATLYRYSNYDTPLWVRSNTRPGRWHAPGDGPTQYLSFTPIGAWADLMRNENLRTEGELLTVHMPLWQVRIDQSNIVDYSDFERAEAAGFRAAALIDDDQERCRAEGKRLRDAGFAGVWAPSAALPGEHSLTIFGARVSIDWTATPTLSSAVPAEMVTQGSPPAELLRRVRFYGQTHADYEAYSENVAVKVRVRRRPPPDQSGKSY
jgi:RES domain